MSEFFATNAPDPPRWNLNSCFGAFHTLWVHLGSFRYLTKLGAKRAEIVQLIQKFVPQSCVFFTTNAPYPPHWNLNSGFGVFRTIWMHLGPFLCLTKLGAKRAEMVQLMQKFVPRSRVRIFRN